jgi:hypothetical protein
MRLPVKKSFFWVIYHRQTELFLSLFLLAGAVASMVLAFANFKTSPASIVLFVAAVYCAYMGWAYSWKLFKEWRNV